MKQKKEEKEAALDSFFLSVQKNKKVLFFVTLCLILFAGSWVRVFELGQLNKGMSAQESDIAINSIESSVTNPIEIIAKPESSFLHKLVFFSFQVLDINLFSLRIIAAIFGILSILGFIFLLRQLGFSKKLILLGSFLLSFSFWHINLSRTLNFEIITICFSVWILALFIKGLVNKNIFGFFFTGIIIGLGTYLSTSILLIIFPILFILLLNNVLDKSFFQKTYSHTLTLLLTTTLLIAPLLFIQTNESPFLLESLKRSTEFQDWRQIQLANLSSNFSAIFYIGDSNQTLNHNSLPMIPFTWSILFLFGIIISIRNITSVLKKNKKNTPKNIQVNILSLTFLTFFIIAASISSKATINSKVLALAMPAIFILCLNPFEYLSQIQEKMRLSTRISLKKWRWHILQFSLSGIVLAILITGFSQLHLYFGVWSKDVGTKQSFHHNEFEFGRILKSLARDKNSFVILPESFFEVDKSKLDVIKFSGFPEINHFSLLKLDELLPQKYCENSFIVFYKLDDLAKKQLQLKCPTNKFRKVSSYDGKKEFWTMTK